MHLKIGLLTLTLFASFLMSCSQSSAIWDGGELREWVKVQAAEQGRDRSTIQLENWYRSESGGNVWHGTCTDSETGKTRKFAIPVDSVWMAPLD